MYDSAPGGAPVAARTADAPTANSASVLIADKPPSANAGDTKSGIDPHVALALSVLSLGLGVYNTFKASRDGDRRHSLSLRRADFQPYKDSINPALSQLRTLIISLTRDSEANLPMSIVARSFREQFAAISALEATLKAALQDLDEAVTFGVGWRALAEDAFSKCDFLFDDILDDEKIEIDRRSSSARYLSQLEKLRSDIKTRFATEANIQSGRKAA